MTRSSSACCGRLPRAGRCVEDVVGLPEDRPRAARIGERDVRPRHLEQRPGRLHGERVGEQRPEPSGSCDELSSLLRVTTLRSDSGRPRVHEGARPIVVELTSAHDRRGLIGERGGCSPVVPFDRRTAAVGEHEGNDRLHVEAGRFVHGAGEEPIGAVGVALEQMGETLDLDHVGAKRTDRAETTQGLLRVTSHRLDPVAAQVRPQEGQHALDRAPVGEHSCRAGRLGGVRPALRRGRPSVDRELQRPGDRDPRVARDQVVGLEPLHPAPDGAGASTRHHGVADRQHEARHRVGVAGLLRVLDGWLREPVRLVPLGGSDVERGDDLGLTVLEFRMQ